jgi:hypothetical protein
MTAQNHYCKSCADARRGAPVPYDDLDPEMVDLVKALNTVPGMRTLDSCFGHPLSTAPNRSHQGHAFVGLAYTGHDHKLLQHFWQDFFDVNYGKLEMQTGFVQFSIIYYPYDPNPDYLIRLIVETEHNPAVDPRGDQEKKEAFLYLQKFIAQYAETHQQFFELAKQS